MDKISAYIIAYNEEDKIADAIKSVLWADEVVVIDSNSTDRTAIIAEELGARIHQVEFTTFGKLRMDAMAACTYDWIYNLDSDERCTDEARDEALEAVRQNTNIDAYYVPRK
ncbi:MAG: glycosyltransferase family 2 protein, partial [Mariprofundaceae bacterium]